MEYNFESDIKFLTGDKALRKSVGEINDIGCRRIMLVCDEMSERVGQIDDMFRQLNKELNIVEKFNRIGERATVSDCEKALRAFKSNDCDSILAVGKKSAMAVAKAVKIMLKDDVSFISNYRTCTVNNRSSVRIPLIVVPTNLSSGTEASNFVRIYDTENNEIFEFDTCFAQTNLIILDPIMTDTLPPKTIAASGLYALAMSVMSLAAEEEVCPLAKVYSVTAINLLTENMKKCILQNKVKSFRFRILLASILAGYAYWQTPKDILSELTDRISDRYRADYGNVFCVLFLRYINLHKWSADFDTDALINLIGDNEYLVIKENTSGRNVVADTVNNYYVRMKKLVDYVDSLKDLGVERGHFADIASDVINSSEREGGEYTFSFIMQLLEDSY